MTTTCQSQLQLATILQIGADDDDDDDDDDFDEWSKNDVKDV